MGGGGSCVLPLLLDFDWDRLTFGLSALRLGLGAIATTKPHALKMATAAIMTTATVEVIGVSR